MTAHLAAALGARRADLRSGALALDGRRIAASERHVRDLLRPGVTVAVHDPGRLRRAVAAGRDPVLYRAYRDVLPERTSRRHGEPVAWRSDVVAYHGATLPTGEPHRSVGHWNLADEWELFQVISGEIVMLVCEGPGEPVAGWRCRGRDVLVLKPGSWHVTYAERGRPVVLNAYSVARAESAPLHDERVKYLRRTGDSPPVVALREGGTMVLVDEATGRRRPLGERPAPRGGLAGALARAAGEPWLGAFLARADDAACVRALPAVPGAA